MRAWRRDTLALDSTTSQSTFLPRTISGFSIESRLGARESGSLSRTIIVSPHRTRSSRDAGAQSLQCVVVELRALAGELLHVGDEHSPARIGQVGEHAHHRGQRHYLFAPRVTLPRQRDVVDQLLILAAELRFGLAHRRR